MTVRARPLTGLFGFEHQVEPPRPLCPLCPYTPAHFIIRNSWGTGWGQKGFAYASHEYATDDFHEAYGIVI
jgi:hypothetical protein